MGYRKTATKGENIMQHRDYIISRHLGLDCDPVPTGVLAEQFDVKQWYMTKFIRQWREEGLLPELGSRELTDDKDMVIQLHADGMSLREIASKWGCKLSSVHRLLIKSGVDTSRVHYAGEPVDSVSLSQLQHCWADLQEPVYVEVGRVTRFYLVPVNVKESNDD